MGVSVYSYPHLNIEKLKPWVGKKVKLKPGLDMESGKKLCGQFDAPHWHSDLDKYVDEGTEFTLENDFWDRQEWVWVVPPGTGYNHISSGFWVASAWLIKVDSESSGVSFEWMCSCSTETLSAKGCSCGAFEHEMQQKGMVRDKWSRLWIKA